MPKAVKDMTRAELDRAYQTASDESSAICDELIKAGRGYEKPTETRTKTDPLSLRWLDNATRLRELVDERAWRWSYHGSHHKVRNKFAR